jgi:hypothetical protein
MNGSSKREPSTESCGYGVTQRQQPSNLARERKRGTLASAGLVHGSAAKNAGFILLRRFLRHQDVLLFVSGRYEEIMDVSGCVCVAAE